MDPIKEAFNKAKQDISELKLLISTLQSDIDLIKRTLHIQNTTHPTNSQTDQQINPTLQQMPFDKQGLYGLKDPYTNSSIGNRGVPTDRQTNQQTDQQTDSELADFVQTAEYLKEDMKKRFSSLTRQEREVFFMIYSLENQGLIVDYSLISEKMGLTESSIRDYVLKICRKGIPLKKSKENNKKVIISVSPEFKKMASLESLALFYHFK